MEWVRSIEMHQEFYSLQGPQTLLFATSHLCGRAQAWCRYLETTECAPTTWVTFRALLLNKFRPENAELLARDRLYGLS